MTEKRNLSLEQKTAARLAATQCLYRVLVTGEAPEPEKLLADMKEAVEEKRAGDKELMEGVEPDLGFLKKLLNGILPERKVLTEVLKEHLSADWSMERMSPLLKSIVISGMYELKHHENLNTPIVVDEYTAIARGFFDEKEVNFVHGILHKLAGVLRT